MLQSTTETILLSTKNF